MIFQADDRLRRPVTPARDEKHGDDSAPKSPGVDRPAPRNPLADRLKKVDPDQAKKYRQRSGE